ncbi:uncharacterized protein [Cherax quadricarinatus]|uniref:uncharacterized protein n=1 Tax=Cherax quadricarinatus TaxID=27406 RepID=UPI00387E3408
MSGHKSFTLSVNSKVAGVVVGAGTAYLLTRISEHTRLTQQISSLHATILEVKDIASLETEFDKAYGYTEYPSSHSEFRKKTVSFSSTTTTGSYKTAQYETDSSRATDTDYYSPDEEEEGEFFDLSPENGYIGRTQQLCDSSYS